MLVLSRKKGQSICIAGTVIEINVVDIRGDSVRLGITAPKEIPVHRREVYDSIVADGEKRETTAPLEGFIPSVAVEVSQS